MKYMHKSQLICNNNKILSQSKYFKVEGIEVKANKGIYAVTSSQWLSA